MWTTIPTAIRSGERVRIRRNFFLGATLLAEPFTVHNGSVVDAKKIIVKFYATVAGNEPVRDFLRDLSDEDRKIVGKDIATVEFSWPVGLPTCRAMGGGLYEVRSDISDRRTVRVLFGLSEGRMLLAHAFIKKTRTTPKDDLDLARKRIGEK